MRKAAAVFVLLILLLPVTANADERCVIDELGEVAHCVIQRLNRSLPLWLDLIENNLFELEFNYGFAGIEVAILPDVFETRRFAVHFLDLGIYLPAEVEPWNQTEPQREWDFSFGAGIDWNITRDFAVLFNIRMHVPDFGGMVYFSLMRRPVPEE